MRVFLVVVGAVGVVSTVVDVVDSAVDLDKEDFDERGEDGVELEGRGDALGELLGREEKEGWVGKKGRTHADGIGKVRSYEDCVA